MYQSADVPWAERPAYEVPLPGGTQLDLTGRPLVMGILNVTPDSFSDGGQFLDRDRAVRHALSMCEEGAEVIDVGGESTRPGSEPVALQDELDRVIPVVEAITDETDVPVSIDTQKAEVAGQALSAGARIINDVSALRTDDAMAGVAARTGAAVVLMHMQGTPETMQKEPQYDDVVADVCGWLGNRMDAATRAGIDRGRILVDPGFGFGKRLEHNLALLRNLARFHELEAPLLVGTSRKSMIGALLDRPPQERLYGTLATVACAVMSGCHIVRVHDVRATREVVTICEAVRRGHQQT